MIKPFSIISKYFNWLQKDNPTGFVEHYPQLDEQGQTTVKGLYIIGDLTGIPLLKFAVESGVKIIDFFTKKDKDFKNRQGTKDADQYDVIIVGAGPAGISAALRAKEKNLRYLVLEANEAFHTIRDFPVGKEMFFEPENLAITSELTLEGKTKEDLLRHFSQLLAQKEIDVKIQSVATITDVGGHSLEVHTGDDVLYKTLRVVLAIGKSGKARRLNISGESMDKVSYRLIDPSEYIGKNITVVGGGDSALESAIALAKNNRVTLVHRKEEFTSPKADNIKHISRLKKEDKLEILFYSNVTVIDKKTVTINTQGEEKEYPNDIVFINAGRELPLGFFNRCGIRVEGTWSKITKWWLAFSLSFATVTYFGKASSGAHIFTDISQLTAGSVADIIFKVVSFLGIIGVVVILPVLVVDIVKNFRYYFATKWHWIKYSYFAFAIILTLVTFFKNKYFGENFLGYDPYFWYGFLYTTSIFLFGVRRILFRKTRYVLRQTITVFLIQALPLFVIPNFILPWMDTIGLIHPWIKDVVFIGGEWWRFVGFILAWPLFIWNIFTDQPSIFWLITSLIQTFVIIPLIVWKWGKGAYCSWICSCGALAETVGDEYRTLAPHGPRAKRWENAGQGVLLLILITLIFQILSWLPSASSMMVVLSAHIITFYKIVVDTIFAGVLGVGLYFFFSGRFWCRFLCPLAALMNIYNKFSRYRIFADKKRCISCGICTKNCHMGIDVMAYAQKGKPLDDVQCVRCSACVQTCPMGVLSFGSTKLLVKVTDEEAGKK